MELYFNCCASLIKYGIELTNDATSFIHVSKEDGLRILERKQISLDRK